MEDVIDEVIEARAKRAPLWEIAFLLGNEDFILAGGCLVMSKPNDYDVFPADNRRFDRNGIRTAVKSLNNGKRKCEVAYESRNALTIKCDGKLIQFCDYHYDSLAELVESFDYSHIQVGVRIHCTETDTGGFGTPKVEDVYFTRAYTMSLVSGETEFVGSNYPLGSLMRLRKYADRGLVSKSEYRKNVLVILDAILLRGFKDYEDFKDQLEAVDLLVLERNESNAAWNLWCTCCDRGLVVHTAVPDDERKED